ncbi:hypothetical protein EMPG_12223 [Blastomyces silverae]|uniref:Uncharacterized protein n=1 Tax=Blastomyces silverae TaxID=2060906 RepID=A0A0H1BNT0_9EURO|nr:hypothetical protein EMPG_12223 [Blastomyces silverae]
MSSSYQSLHSKPSREVGDNWIEGPDASSEEISGHATTTYHDPPRRNWYSRLFLDWWLWEIGACVTSLLALAATVAVLAVYSGNTAPELPKYITLNAIISLLTNVVKFSVLAAVAASISQLKWLWLKDMRHLQDLQIFDNASRGPQGSLYILFHLRGRSPSRLPRSFNYYSGHSFGAFYAAIDCISSEACIQRVGRRIDSTYRQCDLFSTRHVIDLSYPPFSNLMLMTIAPKAQKGRSMHFGVNQGIMNAIFNGDSAPKLEPSCPTGNCTWPMFHSIGVCSRCVDMADKVKLEGACTSGDLLKMEENCTISFQHGVPVVNPYEKYRGPASYIAWLLNYTPPEFDLFMESPQIDGNFAGIRNPLVALGWLEIDYSSLTNTTPIARAMECMFTYCLERYNVSVEAGVSIIKTEPVHLASMDQNSGWNVTAPLLPEKDKERTATFVVDGNAGRFLWGNLITDLVGNATTLAESTELFIPSSDFIGVSYTVDDKVHMMETIARSITYSLLQPSNQTVIGLTGVTQPFIHVRWVWIALPTVVVLGTILFLSLVMLCTKRHNVEVWKSSSLALLYHGLEKPVVEDKGRFTRLSDMTHHAANVRVRFAPSGGETWELQEGGGQSHLTTRIPQYIIDGEGR